MIHLSSHRELTRKYGSERATHQSLWNEIHKNQDELDDDDADDWEKKRTTIQHAIRYKSGIYAVQVFACKHKTKPIHYICDACLLVSNSPKIEVEIQNMFCFCACPFKMIPFSLFFDLYFYCVRQQKQSAVFAIWGETIGIYNDGLLASWLSCASARE